MSSKSWRFHFIILLFITLCHISCVASLRKTKRQIFREQVLPSAGGKIPESAFRSDRLSLNQLNKEGYSIPDGLLLDHRRHVRHPHPYQDLPEVLKVYQAKDGRFVSVFGKNPFPDILDTTYVIRSPVDLQTNQISLYSNRFSQDASPGYKPILIPLTLPNPAPFEKLTTKAFHSRDTNQNNIITTHNKPPVQAGTSVSYLRFYPRRKALRNNQQV